MRLPSALQRSWESQSGLTLGQFTLSLGVIALIMLIAYYFDGLLGEDFRDLVSPAFNWR